MTTATAPIRHRPRRTREHRSDVRVAPARRAELAEREESISFESPVIPVYAR